MPKTEDTFVQSTAAVGRWAGELRILVGDSFIWFDLYDLMDSDSYKKRIVIPNIIEEQEEDVGEFQIICIHCAVVVLLNGDGKGLFTYI